MEQTEKRRGGKKRLLVVIAATAVIVITIVAVVVWPGPKEPEYQGKKLSEWLATRSEHPQESAEAVKAIGTDAIPYLLRWLSYEFPHWEGEVGDFYARHPTWIGSSYAARFDRDKNFDQILHAAAGFAILGPSAKAAIPRLVKIATSSNGMAGAWATVSLSYLGDSAVSPLSGLALGQIPAEGGRSKAIFAMGNMTYLGTNALPCIAVFVRCAGESNRWIRSAALRSMGLFSRAEGQPMAHINWTNAAPDAALRQAAVRAAVDVGPPLDPFVFKMFAMATNDPNPDIRAEAARFVAKYGRPTDNLAQ